MPAVPVSMLAPKVCCFTRCFQGFKSGGDDWAYVPTVRKMTFPVRWGSSLSGLKSNGSMISRSDNGALDHSVNDKA